MHEAHRHLFLVKKIYLDTRDDLDFLQMNRYVPCGIYSIYVYFFYQKQVPVMKLSISNRKKKTKTTNNQTCDFV
jgi:hypothetical protein